MDEKETQPAQVSEKQFVELSSAPNEGGIGYLTGKSTWPEVVGLTAEEAMKKIKQEMPSAIHIHVVPSDSFVTMDFRTDRVRIFIDSSGKVFKQPTIG
ncbi:hypothetical protein BUALT_Bualt09G0115500 [Buddleja alternifolia]|uniref:Uncharacterized protein n=1 Tax=Buddleja alternifolia TaxID=168488 RepID=A0AAV6X8F7_9LAMI|nr:hypothetical protein BUALT_Bualt09G0115500 [Buddleja alternifolia]